jgi:hypothetical protein
MQEMQETKFLILMFMEEHGDVAKVERASPYPFCILKVINKFLDILTNKLLIFCFQLKM